VAGVDSLGSLNEAAQERILAHYDQRGLLYDVEEELGKAYALYQEKAGDFQSGLVEQAATPSASSGRVIYFLTSVTLPAGCENGNVVTGTRPGDAFDRETGAHIDTWALFAAPKQTVIGAIPDESLRASHAPALRAELEAAPWGRRITFFPDTLLAEFEAGVLPGQEYQFLLGADYSPNIKALTRGWAVPKSQEGQG